MILTFISYYFHLAVFFFFVLHLPQKQFFIKIYQLCLLFESYPVNNADRILQTYILITPFIKAC